MSEPTPEATDPAADFRTASTEEVAEALVKLGIRSTTHIARKFGQGLGPASGPTELQRRIAGGGPR